MTTTTKTHQIAARTFMAGFSNVATLAETDDPWQAVFEARDKAKAQKRSK